MDVALLSVALIVLGSCAAMWVMMSLARRHPFRNSKRFKIINISVSALILAVFVGIAATWVVRQFG
jgi:hypothetical protein